EPLHQAIAPGKLPLARLAEARGGSLACEMAGHSDVAHDIARVLCEGFNSVINRRVRHMELLGNSRAEQIPRRRRGKEPFFACLVLDFPLVGERVVLGRVG
ncbi:MAG: hypothetical protein D8B38_00085, partial [Candidatus Saccharimonas sp.]